MKVLKIISTVFKKRTFRNETLLEGEPLLYTVGSQNFKTNKDIKNLILYNLKYEHLIDPGVDMDVLLVNNNVKNKFGNKFIRKLNNRKLPRGKLMTITRPSNNGWSYGAFNYAFNKFKNYYDYFIFIEDDAILDKNEYARIAINKFNKSKRCGFVSFIGLNKKKYFNLNKKESFHAHNAIGLSSKKILIKVQNINGCLPFYSGNNKVDYVRIIKDGEIRFTNIIYRLGYKLIEIDKNIKFFNFAYDLMRGLKVPRSYSNVYALKKFFILIFFKIFSKK